MSRVRSRAVESWSRRAETCTCSPNSFSIIVATFGSLRTVARPTRHPQIGGVEETLRQLEPNASVKEVKAYVDALDAVICARVAICALEGRDKPFGDQGLGDLDFRTFRPATGNDRIHAEARGDMRLDHNQLGIVRRATLRCHWFWYAGASRQRGNLNLNK